MAFSKDILLVIQAKFYTFNNLEATNMKKYKLFAIILSIFILLVGCNKSEKADKSGVESSVSASTQDNVKRNIYISTSGAWGELESDGYITNSTSDEYLNADEYLDFSTKFSAKKPDPETLEKTKIISRNGYDYELKYSGSRDNEPLSSKVEAFNKDKSYDSYDNGSTTDKIEVVYNRDTGKIYKMTFTAKNMEPNENFTHEMAVAEADKLKDSFLGEDQTATFEIMQVIDNEHETSFVEVTYVRTIYGYKTEQLLIVRFNHNGSLMSIGYGKLGFFSNTKCQISALDYYEKLLTKESIENAEKMMKQMIPAEFVDTCTMIIGFDSNGNCFLHTAYNADNSTIIKCYVNLFEIEEKSEVASK